MKKINYLLLVIVLFPSFIHAQETSENKFGINFSGFVKNDFFFDTRQTITAREGHFLLWPSPVYKDELGKDINDQENFNFLAIQSRLSGKITGPEAFGAKTTGMIEADFFGQANANINLFRLRHAFIKLQWDKTELLTGQTWNPLFVTAVFPGTVSFNTGTPLQSFARNPQVRLTHGLGNLKILVAALAQRDYTTRGVNGAISEYLRNSVIPDVHLQLHYQIKDEGGMEIYGGIGGAYKTIVPRLSSTVNASLYKVNESLSGMTAIAFAKVKADPVTVKLQGRYGENIADVLSISGFAVKEVVDTVTGEQTYTPLQNITVWGEVHTNGEKFQVGIFGGYLKNLGTKDPMSSILNEVYGLGTNIESLYRVSPRVIFNSGKARFAGEVEYTSAAFGSGYNVNYQPSSVTSVSNIRFLVSAIYFF